MTTDWKNEPGDHFEAHAEKLLQPIYPWLLEDLKASFSRQLTGRSILEIGCGPGFMMPVFTAAGLIEIIGVDLSLPMLKKARSRSDLQKTSLVQANVSALPFVDENFDLVYSRGSVFFWHDLSDCFKEIYRVLKPGGMAFIGGGYGLSTPSELIGPIKEHSMNSSKKSSIPRIEIATLLDEARICFPNPEILSAPNRGFWLKCLK
jgi:SAM-dependent methyltransferase